PTSAAVEAFVKAGLPRAPGTASVPSGISADVLAQKIDEFLGSRGYRAPAKAESLPTKGGSHPEPKPPLEEKPTDFVCEDDVRQAMRQGRKIVIGDRTIVTPAARDMGDQHRVFVQAQLPR